MVLEASPSRDTICKLIFPWAMTRITSDVHEYLCDLLLTCLSSLTGTPLWVAFHSGWVVSVSLTSCLTRGFMHSGNSCSLSLTQPCTCAEIEAELLMKLSSKYHSFCFVELHFLHFLGNTSGKLLHFGTNAKSWSWNLNLISLFPDGWFIICFTVPVVTSLFFS